MEPALPCLMAGRPEGLVQRPPQLAFPFGKSRLGSLPPAPFVQEGFPWHTCPISQGRSEHLGLVVQGESPWVPWGLVAGPALAWTLLGDRGHLKCSTWS